MGELTASVEAHRGRLFGIAYRMFGQVAEAEDVVQEAYVRYLEYGPAEVVDARAFLVTTATRICLDRLKAARRKREQYFGSWFPEPILTGTHSAPEDEVVRRESLSLALLVLLERLSPVERAVFVLREAFGYTHGEIGRILGKTEGNCRVLLHRAKQRIQVPERRYEVSVGERKRLLDAFLSALQSGDASRVAATLDDDVEVVADGGGNAPASRPVIGAGKVAAAITTGMRRLGDRIRATVAEVNGEPAILISDAYGLMLIAAIEFDRNRIVGMRLVVNPDKLTYAAAQLRMRVSRV